MAEVLAFRVPAGSAHTLLVWGLEPAPGLEVRPGLGLGRGAGTGTGTPTGPPGSPRGWGARPGLPRGPPGLRSGVGIPWVPPEAWERGQDPVEASPYPDLRLQSPPSALGRFSHHLPRVLI